MSPIKTPICDFGINAKNFKLRSTDNKIISLNDVGDLTYPYKSLNGQTQTIKDIVENNNDITKEILNSMIGNELFTISSLLSQSGFFMMLLI